MVSVKGLGGSDWKSLALANDPGFQAIIEQSRRSYREPGGAGIEAVREMLGVKSKPSSAQRRRKRGT